MGIVVIVVIIITIMCRRYNQFPFLICRPRAPKLAEQSSLLQKLPSPATSGLPFNGRNSQDIGESVPLAQSMVSSTQPFSPDVITTMSPVLPGNMGSQVESDNIFDDDVPTVKPSSRRTHSKRSVGTLPSTEE